MKYLSVCSGIEAATVAWHPLGWTAAAFSEIEPFPCAVLAHHYPDVANLGDMTRFKEWDLGAVDLLVGGTPCQSFSVAGLRKGLDDPRGNLMLTYLAIAARHRPRWMVWENVPGVLSADDGRAFGALLGGLAELGYGFAYRVLDAQFCGVPQRRRRVFVVGCLGSWRGAAAVLFERHSLSGNPPPRRQAGQGFTHDLAPSLTASGRGVERGGDTRGQDPVVAVGMIDCTPDGISGTMSSKWSKGSGGPAGDEHYNLITHALTGEGFDASEDGTGRGTPLVAVAYTGDGINADPVSASEGGTYTHEGKGNFRLHNCVAFDTTQITSPDNRSNPKEGDPCHPLTSNAHGAAVAFVEGGHGVTVNDVAEPLATGGGKPGQGYSAALQGSAVRRLTPRECERLQGFEDDYTLIRFRGKPAADGNRYKALGNSMAVPVMAWIGHRIAMVEALPVEIAA